jgi:hypothetical protein
MGQLLVPWLAAHWLKVGNIAPADLSLAVRLAFVLFFF